MFIRSSKIMFTDQLVHRNRLRDSYLLELTVNVLNNQIQGYKVFSTCRKMSLWHKRTRIYWWITVNKMVSYAFTHKHPCIILVAVWGNEAGGFVSTLTSRHHDVSCLHRWLNVLLERRLHKLIVLFDDAADVPSALWNVPLQPPYQADVRVSVHEHLHVQQLADGKGKREHKWNSSGFPCLWVLFFFFFSPPIISVSHNITAISCFPECKCIFTACWLA